LRGRGLLFLPEKKGGFLQKEEERRQKRPVSPIKGEV